jgi:hypothetical protein
VIICRPFPFSRERIQERVLKNETFLQYIPLDDFLSKTLKTILSEVSKLVWHFDQDILENQKMHASKDFLLKSCVPILKNEEVK